MAKEKSKTILITGVSTGIGYGTAKAFIKQGYKVFGSVRKTKDAGRLTDELGQNFISLIFDVTDGKAVNQAVKTVKRELKNEGLGGLINNAGIAAGGPLMDQPIEVIRSHFEVNVFGAIRVTQAFLPLLGAEDNHPSLPGRIINISSVGGVIAGPFLGAYQGSKFAIEGISKVLRRELLLYGIDVIVVGPGAVNTPIWDKQVNVEVYKKSSYYQFLKKFSTYFIERGKKGLPPDYVGGKILEIFETGKPKTRYAIVPDKFQNWTIPRLLPERIADRIIGKRIGFIK